MREAGWSWTGWSWMGLVMLAGVFVTACQGSTERVDEDEETDEDDADEEDDEDDDVRAPAGTRDAGRDAGGRRPSTPNPDDDEAPDEMPPPPDDSMSGARDASVPRRDASAARPDASTPAPSADPVTDISSCTPPPDGSSDSAIRAWTILNEIRVAGGAGCMNMVPELNTSAQLHCDYRTMNRSNPSCSPDGHTQVSGCPGFTGANVQAREIAAGYPRQLAYTEVALTYGDNPEVAIPAWLVTPYHRIPMVDPWTTDMGWGGSAGCDIIDLGRGTARPPAGTISMFPYDGQTDVPPTFNGLESPQPPAPAGGWPSSYPVSIYAERINVTEHVLTKDGDDTPLEHVWLDAQSPGVPGFGSYFTNTAILYGAAFEANTTYRVKIVGTHAGGDLDVEWSFTTGARRPGRF